MKVSPVSSEEGGKVLFSCPRGYTLSGDREASCQASNKWSIKVSSLVILSWKLYTKAHPNTKMVSTNVVFPEVV